MKAINPIGVKLTCVKLIWTYLFFFITRHHEISALTTNSEGIILSADKRVRLVDGISYASGRVEVNYRGTWGTVCDDLWNRNVSFVICRQLGFKGGYFSSTPKPGEGKIWLDDVHCFGNETSLVDCRFNTFGQSNCNHDEDASVKCNYEFDVEFCDFYPNNCSFAINNNNTSTYKWQHSRTEDQLGVNDGQPGYSMYVDSRQGQPGDKTELSNKTGVDIGKGSISFRYFLQGDRFQMLKVFIGAGNKGQLAWSEVGKEDKTEWRGVCLTIREPTKDLVITFEAVRGSNATNVVAIGDVGISTKPCELENISCSFNRFDCGYKVNVNTMPSLNWFFTLPFYHGPSTDHTTNSTDGGFMAVFNDHTEGDRTSLLSPLTHTNQSDKVEFYYYLSGSNPGELQMTFLFPDQPISSRQNTILWQEYGDHGTGWNYACVNLPSNQTGNIVFTAIVGTRKKLNIAIDDISVSQGQCKKTTWKMSCTFSLPQLCHFTISCSGEHNYIWVLHNGSTPTFATGPDTDYSQTKTGVYLYAESSFGHQGDSTTVTFPVTENGADKYMRFSYHMNGKDIGSLHLRFHSHRSSTEEWNAVGKQGKKWKRFCTQIPSNVDAFSLTAVRGSSHLGDIAIDDIQLDDRICRHPLVCDFGVGICNYELQNHVGNYSWRRTSHTDRLAEMYYFMEIKSQHDYQEVATASLISPEINGKTFNGSLRFYYQMYGSNVYKLTISLRDLNNSETELWSHNDKTITDWAMGCINIPPVEKMRIAFISTNGLGPNGVTRLDNLTYHHEKCPRGILKHNCSFDHPDLCGYKTKHGISLYRWIRAKRTPSNRTGPYPDHTGTIGKGYFLYTESSQGRPGEKTDVMFPPLLTPPNHYLRFYYNLNGQDSGELQVIVDTGSMKTLRWSDAGDSKNNWIIGCLNLKTGVNTTIIFTAIRGNGPLGDIAIDDVSVVPGLCPSRSLACEFNDDFLCGYKNIFDAPGWIRIYNNYGFHMKPSSFNNLMRSPSVNLTNSCVRIHYRINNTLCSFHVNNPDKKMMLVAGDKNENMIGQIYIEKAQTFLRFEANDTYLCEILINRVEVTAGYCPSLDCPDYMVACADQNYCINKTWECDREKDCLDGSDESRCPISIACDFSNIQSCGYESIDWEWDNIHVGLMQLNRANYNSSLMSPKQQIGDVCLRFSYRARNQFSLYVLVHYENAKNDSSYTRWQLHFKNNELPWSVGQFFIPAGKVQVEFRALVRQQSFLQIDDVTLLPHRCSPLNCSDETFSCGSEEKCISKKEKCNRHNECDDKSDEQNCPSSLECDFEDNYACGYKFLQNWNLTTGKHNLVPRKDHSKGHSYGHYLATRFLERGFVHLDSPVQNFTSEKCLVFFYSFYGNSQFQVYYNTLKLIIQPFNIESWQKSQIQLRRGVHNLRFSVFLNTSDDKMALDSISTSPGQCPEFVCEENWKSCQPDNICVPHYKFCDHEIDCPNGYDELKCDSPRSVRLVGGDNINQGFVEYYHNSKWNRVCSRTNRPKKESAVVCRELGYRETGWNSLKRKEVLSVRSDINNVKCFGNETSLSDCRMGFCENCVCRRNAFVDCSNIKCSSTKLPCPVKKTENSTRQAHKKDICIPKEFFCDGEHDCPGGTDEENCRQCDVSEFQCLNKKCISKRQRCDGVRNCEDFSDEHHCFLHNGTSLFYLQDEKYEKVCETNLNKQNIANKLCKAVGKGNATIGESLSSGKGIEFAIKRSQKTKFLPGLNPNNVPLCNLLNVSCKGQECGTRGKIVNTKLVQNGLSSFLGQWPWQVVFKQNYYSSCGGILIHPKFVLTNDWCLTDKTTWLVTLGTINKTTGGVQYKTKRKIVRDGFSSYKSGIALLELTEPVEITDYIHPACLPSKPWQPHRECFSTGWGMRQDNYPYQLKEVKVYLFERDDCISHYKDINQQIQCANNDEYPIGCLVDNGGPLVCRNEHGHWEVVGVTSMQDTYSDCNDFSPATFIDVYGSVNWILQHLT